MFHPLHILNPISGRNLNRKDYPKYRILHAGLQILFAKNFVSCFDIGRLYYKEPIFAKRYFTDPYYFEGISGEKKRLTDFSSFFQQYFLKCFV